MGSLDSINPTQFLKDLDSINSINSLKYAQDKNVDHQKIIGVIKSLESLGNVSIKIVTSFLFK